MRDRIKELIDHVANPRRPWADMEVMTGIGHDKWNNICRGRQRANDEVIEKLGELWPQYVFWLVTGKTDERHGQVSPALERIARDLKSVQKVG